MRPRGFPLLISTALLCSCASRAAEGPPPDPAGVEAESGDLEGFTADHFVALVNVLEESDAPMDFLYQSIWSQGDRGFLLELADERPLQVARISAFLSVKLESLDAREAVGAARLLAVIERDADVFNRVAERAAESVSLEWWEAQGRPGIPVIAVLSAFEQPITCVTRVRDSLAPDSDYGPPIYSATFAKGILCVALTYPSGNGEAAASPASRLQDCLIHSLGIDEVVVHVLAVPQREPPWM